MPLTKHDVICKGRAHVEVDTSDETLMMSIRRGQYYALGDTANVIWKKLEGNTRIGDVIDFLSAEYKIETDTCEADVLPFLEQLVEEGLIEKA